MGDTYFWSLISRQNNRKSIGRRLFSTVFDRRTFPVPRSTCSWRVTTYVVSRPLYVSQLGQNLKKSAFYPFGVDKLSSEQHNRMCAGLAIWRLRRCGYQSLCAVRGSNLAELNPSVYSLVPPCVPDVTVDCALIMSSIKINELYYYYRQSYICRLLLFT